MLNYFKEPTEKTTIIKNILGKFVPFRYRFECTLNINHNAVLPPNNIFVPNKFLPAFSGPSVKTWKKKHFFSFFFNFGYKCCVCKLIPSNYFLRKKSLNGNLHGNIFCCENLQICLKTCEILWKFETLSVFLPYHSVMVVFSIYHLLEYHYRLRPHLELRNLSEFHWLFELRYSTLLSVFALYFDKIITISKFFWVFFYMFHHQKRSVNAF